MTQNVWEQEAVKDLVQLEEGEFNLCDFALFLSVMKNETAHRNVLSIIMGEKDLELKEVHVEEVILNRSGQRAIRLDARATDISGRNFEKLCKINEADGDTTFIHQVSCQNKEGNGKETEYGDT